jgi:TolB-like protein
MNKPEEKTGFFHELKRRNVVRVGIAYLVSAWLLLQLADIVLENIAAPQWVMQAFMLALAVGLPIALIFAWAFELTPEGIKREKDVDRSQSITPQTGRKLDFIIIGVLAVVIAVLLADRFLGKEAEMGSDPISLGANQEKAADDGEIGSDPISTPSIAVLPFVNMSSDPEQEFFSDGISEEILNSLARVKELKVAGRTSSFAFKGQNQDLRQIGEALGVGHILEGSVRKSGSTVRITAQLIQVKDGFHLWSDTYDRELTNVFAIQDEISNAILEQMKKHLVGVEINDTLQVAQRTDPEVYDNYLLARQRIYERRQLSIEAAAQLLDEAIARDPSYAPAYAQRGIAALLLSERNYGKLKPADATAQALSFLNKALELDPESAEALAGIGLYHINRPTETAQSIEPLEKALGINPSLIDASNWLQIAYGSLGDNIMSKKILEEMVERDPMYPPGYSNLIQAYNLFGEQEKSQALLERIRPFLHGDSNLLLAEARTWQSAGRPSKSIPLLAEMLASQPKNGVARNLYGWDLIGTGQYEKALQEGLPWHQAIALVVLDRQEEALAIAREEAANGNIEMMIGQLSFQGKDQQLVEFVESRWPDLAALERDYPDEGDGHSMMLSVALAYARTGNDERFGDAMQRVRQAHDRAIQQGVVAVWFDEARYWALAGDSDRAMEFLGKSEQQGLVFTERLDAIFREFENLRGDDRFEALLARVFEHTNNERAELGLEPIAI